MRSLLARPTWLTVPRRFKLVDNTLQEFFTSLSKLESTSQLLQSSVNLREGFTRIFHIAHANARKLFPRKVKSYSQYQLNNYAALLEQIPSTHSHSDAPVHAIQMHDLPQNLTDVAARV